jgi:quercetin dioxygenase-like cupin family protein
MKVFKSFPTRSITNFGSKGFKHARIANGVVQISVAELDGSIGAHEAASRQLLMVLRGQLEVSAGGHAAVLDEGAAVQWERSELHHARALEPSLVLLIEGTFEPLVP